MRGLCPPTPDFPAWLRAVGVILFATGFAPSVQATWREIGYSVVLGAVMAIVFLAAERSSVLGILLPIAIVVLIVSLALGCWTLYRMAVSRVQTIETVDTSTTVDARSNLVDTPAAVDVPTSTPPTNDDGDVELIPIHPH